MLSASEKPNLGLYTLVKGIVDVCFYKGRRSEADVNMALSESHSEPEVSANEASQGLRSEFALMAH
jgi:hypothetical protein